jgi:hypothetical protein
MIRIAILDDYQNAALEMVAGRRSPGRAVIIVFNDHLSESVGDNQDMEPIAYLSGLTATALTQD